MTVANLPHKTPLYRSKFNKGDTVYYVDNAKKGKGPVMSVKKDTPYKVVECRPKSESHYGLSVRLPDGRTPYFSVDDFISEVDYEEAKVKDWLERGIGTPAKKHDFKNGEIAYYNGPDDQFDHHTPFRLWANRNPDVFDIFANGDWGQILVDFVNREFITEEEYKKKYGNNQIPPAKKDNDTRLSSYNTFVNKKFKAGDIVYYVGDKIQRLKLDKPYKIEFYNPLTGLMKIEGDVCPESDFISQEQYEKLKMLNDEDKNEIKGEEGKALDEVPLKMKIYKDTKSAKLKWDRPYPLNEEWFRTVIKLEKPKGAYLRIDVKRPSDVWEMHVYYHRNKFSDPPLFASDNSIEIRNYKESQILKVLVRKIEDQVGDPDYNDITIEYD